MAVRRPSMFIGSSVEGKRIAETIIPRVLCGSKMDSPTLLSDAWWEQDVPAKAYNHPELLKQSKGMNSYVWRKQTHVTFPKWAIQALGRRL
jgi:hypothetical protein